MDEFQKSCINLHNKVKKINKHGNLFTAGIYVAETFCYVLEYISHGNEIFGKKKNIPENF